MMKKVNAMIFTLMMLTVPLAGCTGDDGPVDVLGCKNTQANNYNENVTKDDGTCDYDLDDDGVKDIYEVDGCTDDTANNLDLGATDDDGSCDYTEIIESKEGLPGFGTLMATSMLLLASMIGRRKVKL